MIGGVGVRCTIRELGILCMCKMGVVSCHVDDARSAQYRAKSFFSASQFGETDRLGNTDE